MVRIYFWPFRAAEVMGLETESMLASISTEQEIPKKELHQSRWVSNALEAQMSQLQLGTVTNLKPSQIPGGL